MELYQRKAKLKPETDNKWEFRWPTPLYHFIISFHQLTPSSIRYPIPPQEAGNALVTGEKQKKIVDPIATKLHSRITGSDRDRDQKLYDKTTFAKVAILWCKNMRMEETENGTGIRNLVYTGIKIVQSSTSKKSGTEFGIESDIGIEIMVDSAL
ncbi:hypothetical protein EVAR_5436_1 [Eumeta japonica]|uniref:Uncharacterized protein n=1 Tax=Eumeta variegata TaxID=151549 RepID=A0A4C1T8K7_EUMVA|nr:hypothetical protein EVAR_5436_1 [Eumeta japonica]